MGQPDSSDTGRSGSEDDSNTEDENNISWEEEEENASSSSELESNKVEKQRQSEHRKSTSSSSSSSSESGDSSGNSSGESESESEKSDVAERNKKKPTKIKDNNKNVWEENPDIYGIRRSSRQRKEPNRISYRSSESENDDFRNRRKRKKDSWIPTLSGSESEKTDSSYDVPQRKQTCKGKHAKKGRGRPNNRNNRKKSLERVKSGSQRNIGNTVSYKEDSEDETDSDDIIEQDEQTDNIEDVETIERIVRHRRGWPGQTGAQTTLYSDEVKDLTKLGDPDPENNETELQFLIKWKNWSHLHSTWETKDGLVAQNVKGLKKLDNYIKRMEEIDRWKKLSSPEDVEYFEMQQEMNEDIQKQYQKVERIIAHQFTSDSSSGYPDYFCKWQGLPYFECTWEDGSLTARYFQKQIDEYLERERCDTIPNKNAKCLRQRPKFTSFKTQPDFIGSEELRLRDYQVDGVNWLVHAWCRNTSVILADEMGLGKTIQTISFLSYLFHKYSLYGPFLVVVPLSTMDAWQREFAAWGSAMNVIVYLGDVNSRTTIQEYEWCFKKTRKLKFNVLLTTYEMLLRDKELLGSLNWAVLLIDEAHRLKNEDSLLYRVLIDFKTNFRFLITGTPLQNSLKELWSLLHFLMPNKFDSWVDFESEYSVSDKEGLQKLHRDLEPFLLRRVKKDVEKSLPAKVEQILRVEMSQIQKQYYRLILTRNVQELCKELKGSFSGLLNIVVELKKCCNHSSLIKPLDPEADNTVFLQSLIVGSGKMILLDKLLSRLKETGHRVLIFSQMVRMLDIIADYLVLKRFPYQRLDGSIRGELRKRALDHFNAEGSTDFCFLLSTRAGGLGINLATADTVIIFDSDWNPQNDLQAMARAHRIGQKNQVNIYRFVTKNTIEENIIERAKKKMVLDHLIIQRMDTTGRRVLTKSNAPSSNPFNKEELSSILKFGAEDLFKDHDQDTDSKLHAMDIDDILQRAETQEGHDENAINEDLLSQFKVVNYAAFDEEKIKTASQEVASTPIEKLWEEIIPADERAKIEAEKLEELTLKPRIRKTVEKVDSGPISKKIKSKEFIDDDFSTSSSEDEKNDGRNNFKDGKKKYMKQKPMKKDGVKGFTDAEIRRFIKSYKKFARPNSRLDAISEDAELTDKSTVELNELCALLKTSCEQAVKEYEEKLVQDDQFDGKKKGASLKISGVSCNAHAILKAEKDLEPLAIYLPEETKQLKNYRLTIPTRSVHWGVSWGNKEDSMLLVGMLSYGMGNWDAIKNDTSLELTTKILPKGNGKPQAKHLTSRGEYLLRLLKEHSTEQPKQKKHKHQSKSRKANSDTVIEQVQDSNALPDEKPKTIHDESRKKEKKSVTNNDAPKKKKKDRKSKHIQLKEDDMTVIEIELSDVIFKQCKEKMRTERKSLQLLQEPDQESSDQAQVQTTKKCLLKIGDHIEDTISTNYSTNQELLDSWRSNLWSFVAKFTELGASKLFKLYRMACRKRDVNRQELHKMKANHTNSLHEVGKSVVTNDRLELEEARRRTLGLSSKSTSNKIPKLDKKTSQNKGEKRRHEKRKDSQPWDFRRDQKDASVNREISNSSNSKRNSTYDNDKTNSNNAMTYREWKELKEKRMADEKPFNDQQTDYDKQRKHKKYHIYDEKPPDKYYEPRRPNYFRDRVNEHQQFSNDSPRSMTNISQSPTYFTERMQSSRKRTLSNNSDSISSNDLKRTRNDFEQVSPEPGEIT